MKSILLLFLWAALIGIPLAAFLLYEGEGFWDALFLTFAFWVWWDAIGAMWDTTKRHLGDDR